jgi:hypothetical protein
MVDGGSWIPYQELRVVTPPFPEYVSGHSTFSAAGAQVITTFIGSNNFGVSVTVPAGTSRIEPRTAERPGTPAKDVTLYWPTFSAAANEAGMSPPLRRHPLRERRPARPQPGGRGRRGRLGQGPVLHPAVQHRADLSPGGG